jgi:hypothetical protein
VCWIGLVLEDSYEGDNEPLVSRVVKCLSNCIWRLVNKCLAPWSFCYQSVPFHYQFSYVASYLSYRIRYIYKIPDLFRVPGRVMNFHLATSSRPALGPTRVPWNWTDHLSRGLKRQGREADHSPPTMPRSKMRGSV